MGLDAHFAALLIGASLAINFYPGPNNLFAIANAAHFGLVEAMRASLGRQVAFGLLIALLGVGLGALFIASPQVFLGLKVAGAAFLVWLGVKLLVRPPPPMSLEHGRIEGQRRRMFTDEFQLAFANPKPVLVLLPFLPQLVPAGHVASIRVFAAGALFLVLEALATWVYALVGLRLAWLAQSGAGRLLMGRAGGAAVLASAVLLLSAGR